MLDNKPTPVTPIAPDWHIALAPGDVVLFRFPAAGEAARPRPCLVLDVETLAWERYAALACGIAADGGADQAYEIGLHGAEVLARAGLAQPVRFLGARRMLVPLSHRGFARNAETGTPVLGRLQGASRERMNRVRARLHAERDIAADRRAHRRNRRVPSRAPARPVVVERRLPKRRTFGAGEAS